MRGSLVALPITAWLVQAAPAWAGHATWHATASGDVAATDNVFAVSRDNNPEADAFTQVRPGMLFAYDSPRIIHELTTEVEFLEYAMHSERPSVTERVGYKGFFLPGPRSEMVVAANGSTGQLNALTTRAAGDQAALSLLPPTQAVDVYQADASEMLSWTTSKETRTYHNGFARWTATDDQLAMPTKTGVVEAGGSLGFERTFRSNSFALEAGASYLILDRDAPPGSMPGSIHQRQVNPRGTLVWRHDISRSWSANLDGGAVYVNPIDETKTRAAVFPTFGGLIAYTEVWGRFTVSARRAVTPDLFVALETVSDTAIAQLAMPLPWLDDNPHARLPKLVAIGSLGVERARLLDPENGGESGELVIGRADVGLAWTPRPGQTYGLRYEFIYQHGDPGAVIPLTSFFRNTLFFTFALRYPDRVAAQVPRRTQSVRADRKDLAPVGAEPVVQDPAASLSEEGDDSDRR